MGSLGYRYPASHVFHRPLGRELPVIERGAGAELWDRGGKRYLDGSGGAVVVNIGHGRGEVAAAMAVQAGAVAYVHGTHFTSEPLGANIASLTCPPSTPTVSRRSGSV